MCPAVAHVIPVGVPDAGPLTALTSYSCEQVKVRIPKPSPSTSGGLVHSHCPEREGCLLGTGHLL